MTALSEPPITSETTDLALAERARAGDSEAFGELYSRYFTPIHDFVGRMLRNQQDAADVTQEAFLRALRSIDKLDEPGAVRGWLYTIARNTALNRLRVPVLETKERVPLGEDGDAAFDVVDPDAFADPAEAAEARAMSRLVWEAAAGLSVSEYTLLDLHVRHELGGAEIAKVLGTSPNSVYVRLNRVRKTFERSVKALVLMQSGKESCERLALLLEERGFDRMSPEVLRVIEDHARDCDDCERRKGALLAPLTAFGALAPVAADPSLYAGIFATLSAASAAGATGAGAGAAAGSTGAAGTAGTAGAAATGGIVGSVGAAGLAIAAAVAVVTLVAAALVLPISPVSIGGGGDDAAPASIFDEPTPNPTQAAPAAVPPTETPADTPTPIATEAAAAAATPSPVATEAVATPPPASPEPTEEPSSVSNDPVDAATPAEPAEPTEPAATPQPPAETAVPATQPPATPTPAVPTPTLPPATNTPVPPATEPPPTEVPTVAPSPEPTEEPAEDPTATPSPTPAIEPSPTATPPPPTPTATPSPAPNLLFSVALSGGVPLLNVAFELVATVENEGPGTAFDVVFEAPLPPGLTLLELQLGQEGVSCEVTGGTLVCTIAEIAPGETITIPLLMLMTEPGADLALEFTLLGLEGSDGSQAPMVVSLPLEVLAAGLQTTATFADDGSVPAPSVRYVVENTGGVALDSIVIEDADCPGVLPLASGDADAPLLPGETREFACESAPASEYEGSAVAVATSAAGDVEAEPATYVVDLLPRVAVSRTVDPAQLTAPGGGVTVQLVIANKGTEALSLVSATDSELGDVMEACGFATEIPAGTELECALRTRVAGAAGDIIEASILVVVTDDEANEASAEASSSVELLAPPEPFIFEFTTAFPYFEAEVDVVPFIATITNNGPGELFAYGGTVSGSGVALVDEDCTGSSPIPVGESLECRLDIRIVGAVGLERTVSANVVVQRAGQAPEVVTRQLLVTGCAGLGSNGEPECPWNDSDVEGLVVGGVLPPGSVATAFTAEWSRMVVPAIAFVAGLVTLALRRRQYS